MLEAFVDSTLFKAARGPKACPHGDVQGSQMVCGMRGQGLRLGGHAQDSRKQGGRGCHPEQSQSSLSREPRQGEIQAAQRCGEVLSSLERAQEAMSAERQIGPRVDVVGVARFDQGLAKAGSLPMNPSAHALGKVITADETA